MYNLTMHINSIIIYKMSHTTLGIFKTGFMHYSLCILYHMTHIVISEHMLLYYKSALSSIKGSNANHLYTTRTI